MSQITANIHEYTSNYNPIYPTQQIPIQNTPVHPIIQNQHAGSRDQQPQIINMQTDIPRELFKPEQSSFEETIPDILEETIAESLDSTTSAEQQADREKLIDSLTDYQFSRFGERILEHFPDIVNDIHSCSKQELELRLLTCQKFIQKRGRTKQGELIFRGVLGVCDYSCTLLGMHVAGARESLTCDPDVLDTVEEVQLKYKAKIQVEPEYRLGFAILNAYFMADCINKQRENAQKVLDKQEIQKKITEHLDKTVQKEFENNFVDL